MFCGAKKWEKSQKMRKVSKNNGYITKKPAWGAPSDQHQGQFEKENNRITNYNLENIIRYPKSIRI